MALVVTRYSAPSACVCVCGRTPCHGGACAASPLHAATSNDSNSQGELEDIDALIAEFGAVEEDTSEENRADASPNDKGSPDPKKLSENEMPADDDF